MAKALLAELRAGGWEPLECDPCCLVLRVKDKVEGITLLHVDDMAICGQSAAFWSSIERLRSRFEFGAWKEGGGEFLGALLTQLPDYSIEVSMAKYAAGLRPIKFASGLRDVRRGGRGSGPGSHAWSRARALDPSL